jgi:hypothetical protein
MEKKKEDDGPNDFSISIKKKKRREDAIDLYYYSKP